MTISITGISYFFFSLKMEKNRVLLCTHACKGYSCMGGENIEKLPTTFLCFKNSKNFTSYRLSLVQIGLTKQLDLVGFNLFILNQVNLFV
jgi:hypothetical protein